MNGKEVVDQRAIQPQIVTQPVRYESRRCELEGASIETQKYCPPEMGAIELSSHKQAYTEVRPAHASMKPYKIPGGPPL